MTGFIRSAAAAAMIAALFPVSGAAQPQRPQGPGQAPGAGPAARQERNALRRPQLTEQQREQLRTFEEQNRTAAETARRELTDLNHQLDEALAAAQIDTGKVNQLRSAIVQKETALAQQRIERRVQLASILTPEQRQALGARGAGRMFGLAEGRGRGLSAPRAPRAPRPHLRQAPRPPMGPLRGDRGMRGPALRERLDEARLRAEMRRLEAQLEALRRRKR